MSEVTHVNRVTLIFDVASTKDGDAREVSELADKAIAALRELGIPVSWYERAHKSVKRLQSTQSPAHIILRQEPA